VKVLGLGAGVNITIGLPFVRRSMIEALRQAVALAPKGTRATA
jgi:4-hydroxy-L-threonine phosphate dehydrogenase PdxA